jgi:ParB family chromosome partitioning protein
MADEPGRARLGRGLAALIGEVGDEMAVMDRARGQRRAAIELLRPNPRNPRKAFPDEELDELAASIRQRGILQPIVVRALPNLPDAFEIIAGERRWRAAQRAGLHEVPIVIVEADDRTSLEYAILENVQRTDLNALEEAAGYDRLMAEFGYSQADLGGIIGKSRSHIANTLRLLNLPPTIQGYLADGKLSAGHARALLAVRDSESVAQRIMAEGLTVRDVEQIAQVDNEGEASRGGRPRRASSEKDADTRALEKALGEVLGLNVSIVHKNDGGEVRIRYSNLDQLDALCRRLKVAAEH